MGADANAVVVDFYFGTKVGFGEEQTRVELYTSRPADGLFLALSNEDADKLSTNRIRVTLECIPDEPTEG